MWADRVLDRLAHLIACAAAYLAGWLIFGWRRVDNGQENPKAPTRSQALASRRQETPQWRLKATDEFASRWELSNSSSACASAQRPQVNKLQPAVCDSDCAVDAYWKIVVASYPADPP